MRILIAPGSQTAQASVIEMADLTPKAVPSTVPIIIGVTGHRDIIPEDSQKLAEQVEAVFKRLSDSHKATPLLVLSPLAEGADRIVAGVALKHDIDLIVPLPMPIPEYKEQFDEAKSKEEFDLLLSKARKWFVVPRAPGFKDGQELDFNQKYSQVGAYIAYHSHILIALWDGRPDGPEGGTSQIVDFKLKGIPMPYASPPKTLDIVDDGPVFHILTPREGNPRPEGTAFALKVQFPESWIPVKSPELPSAARSLLPIRKAGKATQQKALKAYERILVRMNTFNADSKCLGEKLEAALKQSRTEMIPEPEYSNLTEPDRFILARYVMADTLAAHFQKRRHRTLVALFLIGLVAVSSFATYAHLVSNPWIVFSYLFLLGVAVSVYFVAKCGDFQNKHLDYRALAEGLRVQFFWNLAGLSEEVAERYLRQHQTELEWIRNAIRAWNVLATNVYGAGGQALTKSVDSAKTVSKYWVDRERDFFRGRTDRNRSKSERGKRCAQAFFFLTLAIAMGILVLHFVRPGFEESHLRHWLIVSMIIFASCATVVEGYLEKMAFSTQAKRYEWMSALFERAGKRLEGILNKPKGAETSVAPNFRDVNYTHTQQLLLDLGCEALEENGDWVMIHREKAADVHMGA